MSKTFKTSMVIVVQMTIIVWDKKGIIIEKKILKKKGKTSKKTKNDAEIKSHYVSLKLTEMLLEEEKRLTKKLQRIRTEQYIELEKERARWRILKSLD